MEIKTKFNIGSHIYGITYSHKLVEFDVARINIIVNESSKIDYYPSDGKGGYEFTSFAEKYCFATKEEALAFFQGED